MTQAGLYGGDNPRDLLARAGQNFNFADITPYADALTWREPAVVFSVCRLSVLDHRLQSAKNTVFNMSRAIGRGETEWYGTAFSPREVAETHGCAMVGAARLIGFYCERGEVYAHTCRAAQDALEMARRGLLRLAAECRAAGARAAGCEPSGARMGPSSTRLSQA